MTFTKNGKFLGLFVSILASLPPLPLAAEGETPSFSQYEIKRGDCLWNIAADKAIFGDPWKWPLIYEANKDQIQNPDLIEIGWQLKIPMTPSVSEVGKAKAFAQSYKETVQVKHEAKPAAKSDISNSKSKENQPVAALEKAEEAAPVQADPASPPSSSKGLLWLFGFLGVAAVAYFIYKQSSAKPEELSAPYKLSSTAVLSPPPQPLASPPPVAYQPPPAPMEPVSPPAPEPVPEAPKAWAEEPAEGRRLEAQAAPAPIPAPAPSAPEPAPAAPEAVSAPETPSEPHAFIPEMSAPEAQLDSHPEPGSEAPHLDKENDKAA